MATIPAKVQARLVASIKKFQPIVKKGQSKDINESDTVTIIVDMLNEVFGYDKWDEITSEFTVKNTFCDLALQINGKPYVLIEVKAAGLDLKDAHIKQAVDYGANAGIDWVVLTNSVQWKVYRVVFAKPISAEPVYEFDITKINVKKHSDLEMLFHLTKEAIAKGSKSSLEELHSQQQSVNRFTIGQLLISDVVIDSIRRPLRRLASDAKITNEDIRKILLEEIIKRDVFEDERSADAKVKVAKALKPPKPSTSKAENNKA